MTDKEITNLKKHLNVGDEVYVVSMLDGIKADRVVSVGNQHVKTCRGLLAYDTYRQNWFLTERVAREAAGRLGA